MRAEGQKALPNFAKGPVAEYAARTTSNLDRAAVRSDALVAIRAHQIATGERS